MDWLWYSFSFLTFLSLLIWTFLYFHPARFWDFQPVGDDPLPPDGPDPWPPVCILVPARNETESLPKTLPALLAQDYPGEFHIIVIDDRSDDGTTECAEGLGLTRWDAITDAKHFVIKGQSLPEGWVGKMWALEQGRAALNDPKAKLKTPEYVLLTDADILHKPGSLKRLVAESAANDLALNSRMARLRCISSPEKLLIPPFVFFFNLLYPMRRVNDAKHPMAAAAGGCVLLKNTALEKAGGFACVKDRIIDDVNLARAIKAQGVKIRLTLSRTEVESLRVYDSLGEIWKMVRRTAFTELKYSYIRLAGSLFGLTLLFVIPPLASFLGGGIAAAAAMGKLGDLNWFWPAIISFKGFMAWSLMASVYTPAIFFFKLDGWRVWTLPVAGVLYGMMTFDSARRHLMGQGVKWR